MHSQIANLQTTIIPDRSKLYTLLCQFENPDHLRHLVVWSIYQNFSVVRPVVQSL
jgi:hypothetical protein